jgi:hypothetical protein
LIGVVVSFQDQLASTKQKEHRHDKTEIEKNITDEDYSPCLHSNEHNSLS